MKSVILFRDQDAEEECATAATHLPVVKYRSSVAPQSLVIGRYSVLPYYKELEDELRLKGSALINTYPQHKFIADVMEWGSVGGVLDGLTPRTWTEWGGLPEGQYVVKGRTNSRKHKWNTHMYAPTKAAIPVVAQRLYDDAFIGDQGLVVREYFPLRKLGEGLNGLPVTNEWRTFWLVEDGVPYLLTYGFYWASHPEVAQQARFTDHAYDIAEQAAYRVADHATFFVLDLAQREDGRWTVVEVNDGQMSGLSLCSAEKLYGALKRALGFGLASGVKS